ncbi:RidA family protein [Ferrovibrio sp.]|jgi:enamine deaminase RidA (YjgF/YER057c/UK114 family)|uniref:RidA family protein n=1 Tax=Ferrovibrio sp. TaxID=1917215 RepID=UPI0035B2FBF4
MMILNPAEWAKPKGYANGIAAEGRLVFIAGQIGWTAEARFESDDLVDQTRQALRNIVRVLAEAGARPEHVVRLTWYVVDKRDYLARNAELGKVYREIMGKHYPAMTLVQVAALLEDRAKVEIEATAVLPVA